VIAIAFYFIVNPVYLFQSQAEFFFPEALALAKQKMVQDQKQYSFFFRIKFL